MTAGRAPRPLQQTARCCCASLGGASLSRLLQSPCQQEVGDHLGQALAVLEAVAPALPGVQPGAGDASSDALLQG